MLSHTCQYQMILTHVPKRVEARPERRVTHMTYIQETGPRVLSETKHHQSFPEPNQVSFQP